MNVLVAGACGEMTQNTRSSSTDIPWYACIHIWSTARIGLLAGTCFGNKACFLLFAHFLATAHFLSTIFHSLFSYSPSHLLSPSRFTYFILLATKFICCVDALKLRQQPFERNSLSIDSNVAVTFLFFTPFVAEVPYHILLYVVVHCTKGVVEPTYK